MKTTLLAASIMTALSATASDIETIEVTADYRVQNIQTIPASVSVLTEQEIDERQARHIEDVLNMAANINVNSGASRSRFVQIRGIGERSQFSEPLNPSVALLIDGVNFSGMGGAGTLFDVQQVEILRGPQSTSIGAAALAGAINITSTEATADQQSLFTATLAQRNTLNLGLAHGGEISERLFYRFAIQQNTSDGFVDNIYLDREDTNNIDELTARLKLRYLVSDDVTIDLALHRLDIDNGFDAFSLDNDGKTRSDEPGYDRQETTALTIKLDWQHRWGNVQSVLTHSDSDIDYSYDEDWTYVGFHPWEYSSFDAYFRERQTTTIDVRALSTLNQPGRWVIGFYASNSDEELLRQYTYADADFSSEYRPENVAVYAEYARDLSDKMTLTGALRWDRFDIDYSDNSGFAEANEDTMVGGKLVLNYTIDDAMLYAGIFRGYKAGGFNPDENVGAEKRLFAPEYTWNYEMGVKGSFARDNGYYRAALFTMKRNDTQVSDYDVQRRDDGTVEFFDVIANADNGENTGVELEVGLQATENLFWRASMGLLNATYSGYKNARGETVPSRQQAQAPEMTFHFALRYALNDQWNWYVDLDAKSDYYFSDGHDEQSRGFGLVNTSVEWQGEQVSVRVYANNLTDKEYYTRGFGGFSNDPREFYATPKPYYQLGNGRQVGVTLDYRF